MEPHHHLFFQCYVTIPKSSPSYSIAYNTTLLWSVCSIQTTLQTNYYNAPLIKKPHTCVH